MPDDLEASPAADSTRQFGDYELIEQLGRGGMGVIYKARQLRLNRLVAIKMISAGEFASPTLIQRFHREAEAAANLNHPNIVPIFEIGELRGQHFYSMQLVDGTSAPPASITALRTATRSSPFVPGRRELPASWRRWLGRLTTLINMACCIVISSQATSFSMNTANRT
jgi:hypothetical protein